ncbi:hypothetical protein SA19142_01650 [Staphylococcus argenteus]|uniref:Uncharacterized protein n=2 Tax=Staphylococcus argenteus TaxID=985002 RepID=A0A7U7PYQ0_9STAP|nr:hypothetical protein BN1326_60143 [Staphylococcus argenteus]CRI25690.1 hypothetical protein BN1326_60143 [Staphylococcus argenteus]BCR32569.1 hypothetical protein SARG0275_09520 [Staphylococcus argenteus]GBU02540.1 hypothetical protein SARG0275_16210 [Staphylococcus argenteus]GJF35974.1 hypothetical protein SA19023_07290 [Staphylococcus argenteus]
MSFSLTIILCQSFEMMVIYLKKLIIATTIPMKVILINELHYIFNRNHLCISTAIES